MHQEWGYNTLSWLVVFIVYPLLRMECWSLVSLLCGAKPIRYQAMFNPQPNPIDGNDGCYSWTKQGVQSMVKHVRCFNVDCQTPTFLLSVFFLNFPSSGPQKPLIESISHFVCRTPPPQDEVKIGKATVWTELLDLPCQLEMSLFLSSEEDLFSFVDCWFRRLIIFLR